MKIILNIIFILILAIIRGFNGPDATSADIIVLTPVIESKEATLMDLIPLHMLSASEDALLLVILVYVFAVAAGFPEWEMQRRDKERREEEDRRYEEREKRRRAQEKRKAGSRTNNPPKPIPMRGPLF